MKKRVSEEYEFQSDLVRKRLTQEREEGFNEGFIEGFKNGFKDGFKDGSEDRGGLMSHTIVEIVCARFPGLHEEAARWVRGQPATWLEAAMVELSLARDEAQVRAILSLPSSLLRDARSHAGRKSSG